MASCRVPVDDRESCPRGSYGHGDRSGTTLIEYSVQNTVQRPTCGRSAFPDFDWARRPVNGFD